MRARGIRRQAEDIDHVAVPRGDGQCTQESVFAGLTRQFELNVSAVFISIFAFGRTGSPTSSNALSIALRGKNRRNASKWDKLRKNSMMLVTALSPKIGYDKARRWRTTRDYHEKTRARGSRSEARLRTGAEFDSLVHPRHDHP